MTHSYSLKGMTCGSCESFVKSSLLQLADIESVAVSRESQTATIKMAKHVSIDSLQKALGGESSKYRITPLDHVELVEQTKSWWQTYKPIILIFLFLTGVTASVQWNQGSWNGSGWMADFMAGFFLVFSFFKLLDIQGFAESYRMYDLVAAAFPAWGILYPFVELSLGLAYLLDFMPTSTHILTIIIMSVSIVGVIQSLRAKRKIRCACLGAVFNLPMSTITFVEDALMILMATYMLIM
jgi:copper chaperone CopZ